MSKKVNKIIKHLSLKHNIPSKDIEDAVNSQFLFVKKIIESATKDEEETFKTVKLLSFGKFLVKKNRIYNIIKNKKNGNRSK